MKRLILGAVVTGLLGFGAPVASAAERYAGGCDFVAVHSEAASRPDEFTGVIYAGFTAYDDATASPLPVEGQCWIEVDGVVQPDTVLGFSGNGVAAGARTITYTAPELATVEQCESITYGSSSASGCNQLAAPLVPPEVFELLDEVIEWLIWGGPPWPDLAICSVLVELGVALDGGIDGVLEIDAEGDVAVADIPFWDCPPYGS